MAELLELNRAGELGVRAFTFDGDTPGDARQAIRLHGDIVVSNPDMLHQAILPHHTKWAQFFENLRYVVIDEIHTYRGVFGSHVTNVIRRLKRICAFYGVQPQFILCSATIGNPHAHAEALVEERVHAITESGAPSGPKHVLLWNPPVINPDLGLRASARSQANRIARIAIKSGLKTLVFAQTRLMVEVLTKYLKDIFDNDPRKPARIRAYRGGYLPTERREVERAMRAGDIDGIVSTSALELGVDIGALDVVVLNGYPGSVAATWQRFGRAGRRQQAALGVMVASMVQSTPYQVERLDWDGRKAYVTRTHVDYYTDSIDYTKLKVLDRFDGNGAGRGDAHHGEVHVVRRVAGYKKIRYYTHENIGYGPVNLPDQELHTTAVWWQLPQATLLRSFAQKQDALDGFLGAAYALHIVATVAVMADARDLQKAVGNGDGAWFAVADQSGRGQLRGNEGGEAAVELMQSFVPTVYLYDNFPGGVGLSEPLWQRQGELVQRALELVERCDCTAGCPACVGPVLAAQEEGQGETPRSLALRVLSLLSDEHCGQVQAVAGDAALDLLP